MHSEAASSSIQASPTALEKSQNQWIINTPEYLLLLVIAFIIWTFGFIELLNTTSLEPDVFGLYTWPIFILLVGSSLGFIGLGVLLSRPQASGWLTKSAAYVQSRPLLAIVVFSGFTILSWILITLDPYSFRGASIIVHLPVNRFVGVALLTLAGGVLLWGGWTQVSHIALWRKAITVILVLIIGIEITLQGLAYYNLFPGNPQIQGLFVPYGRVYQNQEGFANGYTNNYGWYYPDFKLRKESRKILLIGDSFIQALQINPDQHLGVHLETMINEQHTDDQPVEILAMGMPGFGPGLYLSETRLTSAIEVFNPDEVIVLFHLGSDFHTETVPSKNNIVFEIAQEGQVNLHPESVYSIHDQKHYILAGYEFTVDPLATLQSQYLTSKFITQMLSNKPLQNIDSIDAWAIPGFSGLITDQVVVSREFTDIKKVEIGHDFGKSNHLFQNTINREAEQAITVTTHVLKQAQAQLAASDIDFRIVTIPAFPKAFYTQNQGTGWQPNVGDYDLFQPEQILTNFAEEAQIPLLPMGQYLQNNQVDLDTIQSAYFFDGIGHFTPEGHRFFAEAIYDCIYRDQSTSICPSN